MKEEGVLEFGQLPVLVWPEDGAYLTQSNAILRALGIRFGYYPTDPMERWQVDSTLDAIADIYELVAKCYFGATADAKQESLDELMGVKLPKFMSCMNTRLQGKRYMVGYTLTIADFALGSFFHQTVINENGPHYELFLPELQKYKHCIAFVKHFHDDNLQYVENMKPSFF